MWSVGIAKPQRMTFALNSMAGEVMCDVKFYKKTMKTLTM